MGKGRSLVGFQTIDFSSKESRENIMNMDAIGIIGMVFGLAAFYRVYKLEKILKEQGVIDKDLDLDK